MKYIHQRLGKKDVVSSSGQRAILFSFVALPWTVHALTWSKSPKYEDPNSMEAKLMNKGDQDLIQDLKDADLVYVENNIFTHQEIYDKLSKHWVCISTID